MASVIAKLKGKGLVRPPPWLVSNLVFEGETGSVASGCGVEKIDAGGLDLDLVGIAIAPKQMVCPQVGVHIAGFRTASPTFSQWQQHHVEAPERRVVIEATVYGLVRFFELAREDNPNIVHVIFTPGRCMRHTKSGRGLTHTRLGGASGCREGGAGREEVRARWQTRGSADGEAGRGWRRRHLRDSRWWGSLGPARRLCGARLGSTRPSA